MYQNWFLDYASYVILERAVPHLVDGLKPVQRRILHTMKTLDDGRYSKVANIVGQAMQYHPHGDASISDALVQLGRGFDCWLNIDIESLFGSVLTTHTTDKPRKCIVDEPVNIFVEACHNNGDIISGHRRKFPLGRTVLLYAFVYYLQHKDTIEEAQFARRIRMVSNLIKGSEYELRENNLANLIRQTEYVLDNGDIEEGYLSFNANQLIEEHEKVEWLKNNHEKEDVLCKLENHNLLQGAIYEKEHRL